MAVPAPKPQIDTCNACGKLFPRMAMRLCGGCAVVEEHRFELVRQYVIEHDGAEFSDIARGTGVMGADVRKFMDSGRLVQVAGAINTCTCGGRGERCRACRAKLSSSFRDLEQSMRADAAGSPRLGGDDEARVTYERRIRRLPDAS